MANQIHQNKKKVPFLKDNVKKMKNENHKLGKNICKTYIS